MGVQALYHSFEVLVKDAANVTVHVGNVEASVQEGHQHAHGQRVALTLDHVSDSEGEPMHANGDVNPADLQGCFFWG